MSKHCTRCSGLMVFESDRSHLEYTLVQYWRCILCGNVDFGRCHIPEPYKNKKFNPRPNIAHRLRS